jgi:ureidoacrylate peracid hydrolase
MHRIQISPDLLTQVNAERGGPHIFDKLDMRRTAHLIVDLQNGFMEPGAPVEVPVAREIVSAVNSISAAVRERGGLDGTGCHADELQDHLRRRCKCRPD